MAVVVYTDFTSNQPLSAGDVYGYFYTWDGDSLEVVNGRLDSSNVSLSTTTGLVDYTLIQDGAVSGGAGVSGTANLDFFSDALWESAVDTFYLLEPFTQGVFGNVPSTLTTAADNHYIALPGGSIQFFLPQKSRVLLTWQVVWVNDSTLNSKTSHMRLFIDNDKEANDLVGADSVGGGTGPVAVRRVKQTMFRSGSSSVPGNRQLRDRYKSRYWSGHYWVDSLERGWHSASLRVIANMGIKQTRVRCRNMKHIYFSYRDS